MTRRALAWIGLVLLGVGGATYAWREFPRAFSILSLDLQMDRTAALASAEVLASAQGWGPADQVRSSALFDLDGRAQTFIELEGGGPEVFKAAVTDGRFHAYRWKVRRFAPEEVNETTVEFSPAGAPIGFVETIAEDAPGPALARDSARVLALATAAEDWALALTDYQPIEAAQETRPGGRVDHTFVFESPDRSLGEGRLRVRIVVAGDRVTALERFLHVPEAFDRGYDEMRSRNDAIAEAATMVMLVLYGILGVGFGMVAMLRIRMLSWRPAARAGVVFGVLAMASTANGLPVFWSAYDTSMPVSVFLLLQVALVLVAGVGTFFQVGLSAAAAESLSRAAFPHQPQFWRIWSREAGGSRDVLGWTLIGYLLIGAFLAYVVGFYGLSRSWEGWWSPTDTLAQPNLFATYFPWLAPVATALQAGFWEELLFRAVPLGGAALLGNRFGRRGLWIGAAFVLQAVVFAAAHANYPTQPSYARLVELLLPSFLFGWVFLRHGLFPAIVLHAGYDLVLMAMPIFVASSEGIWFDRTMVLAVGLLPLGVVVWRRLQAGAWRSLPDELRNRGWQPPPPRVRTAGPARAVVTGDARPAWLVGLAAFGVVGLAVGSRWEPPLHPLTVTRSDAVAIARDTVAANGVDLEDGWRVLAAPFAGGGDEHRFIWETAGDSVFRSLLGDVLGTAQWQVRFARFEGDVAERAEEWGVRITGAGEIGRVRHLLPEGKEGASLDEEEAREIVDSALRAELGDDVDLLDQAAVEPTRHPGRTDWEMTYTDERVSLPVGEIRVAVDLQGDEPSFRRYVFIPESWQREWDRRSTSGLLRMAVPIGLALVVILTAFVMAVVRTARGGADRHVLVTVGAASFLTVLAALPGSVAQAAFEFETSRPWALQYWSAVGWSVFAGLIGAAALAVFLAAFLPRSAVRRRYPPGLWAALGLGLAGLGPLLGSFVDAMPGLPVGALASETPLLDQVAEVPGEMLFGLAALILVYGLGSLLGERRPRLWLPWFVVAGLCFGLMASDLSGMNWPALLVAPVAVVAFAAVIRRVGVGVLVPAAVVSAGVNGLPAAIQQGPVALVGLLVAVGIAWLLIQIIWRIGQPEPEPDQPDSAEPAPVVS